MTTKHCFICGDERVVEQPPCLDGHEECPEWVCVDCGTAIVAGWITDDAAAPAASGGTAA